MLNECIGEIIYLSAKVSFPNGWSEFRVYNFVCEAIIVYSHHTYIVLHLSTFTFICHFLNQPLNLVRTFCNFSQWTWSFLPWRTLYHQQTLSQHIHFSRSFMNMLNSRSKNSTMCNFTTDLPLQRGLVTYLPLFSRPELMILSIFFISFGCIFQVFLINTCLIL